MAVAVEPLALVVVEAAVVVWGLVVEAVQPLAGKQLGVAEQPGALLGVVPPQVDKQLGAVEQLGVLPLAVQPLADKQPDAAERLGEPLLAAPLQGGRQPVAPQQPHALPALRLQPPLEKGVVHQPVGAHQLRLMAARAMLLVAL